jgi:hypothetical protein
MIDKIMAYPLAGIRLLSKMVVADAEFADRFLYVDE